MNKKVLIIEDSAVTASMLASRIQSAGYEVLAADDGEKGLAIMRQEHPDLVVLDIRLPGIDGFEVGRIAKSDQFLKNIPIVAVTTATKEEDKRKAKDIGIDSYITKPYDGQELLVEIKRLLK